MTMALRNRLWKIAVAVLACASWVPSAAADPIIVTGTADVDVRAGVDPSRSTSTRDYEEAIGGRAQVSEHVDLNARAVHKYGSVVVSQATAGYNSGSTRAELGIITVPFGLYNNLETYTSGIIGNPLVRDSYSDHATTWSLPGVLVTQTTPSVQVTAAGFDGRAYSDWNGASSLSGGAVRAQAYTGDLIVGVSGWAGSQNTIDYGRYGVTLWGVDARYSLSHLVVRGEYIHGLIGGDTLDGAYVDTYYRLPGVETVTLVNRLEYARLAADIPYLRQWVVGARWTFSRGWFTAANLKLSNAGKWYDTTGFKGQRLVFQIYHVVNF